MRVGPHTGTVITQPHSQWMGVGLGVEVPNFCHIKALLPAQVVGVFNQQK